jgi:PilZ domain
MVEPAAKLRIAPPARQDAAFHERRQSPRYRLRDVHGSLAWQAADGPASGDVTVLNISGGGAAVLAAQAPGAGQAVRLHLDCESARFEPVEAVALAASPDDSGKTLVRLRFDHWVALDAILEKHHERRLWERYAARESRATLTWHDGSSEQTIRGDLLNISGGGAAFVAEVQPPPGVPVWLELEAGARRVPRVDPVESQLVATSADPSGLMIAHLQFVDPCPMELFELTVNGA